MKSHHCLMMYIRLTTMPSLRTKLILTPSYLPSNAFCLIHHVVMHYLLKLPITLRCYRTHCAHVNRFDVFLTRERHRQNFSHARILPRRATLKKQHTPSLSVYFQRHRFSYRPRPSSSARTVQKITMAAVIFYIWYLTRLSYFADVHGRT